jgi:LAO/AO transport system kinase
MSEVKSLAEAVVAGDRAALARAITLVESEREDHRADAQELLAKVAVLAVDPSSRLTGGSILGDKARMDRLAQEPNAFIRPSPSGATLGGVARRTREAMLLCEAAGFDVVLVETVGVGQSETLVADMVDCFVVLMQPGSGDELQGIKKGVLEHADLLVVNKADGENLPAARTAVRDLSAALRYLRPATAHWSPRGSKSTTLRSRPPAC